MNIKPFHLPKRCRLPFATGVTSSTQRHNKVARVICDIEWQRSVPSSKGKERERHVQLTRGSCSVMLQTDHSQQGANYRQAMMQFEMH